jgi:hypothetical protein
VITKTTTDVFLSHSPQDQGLADLIAEECREAGLEVYRCDDLEPGGTLPIEVRRELVESSAAVFLATRSFAESPNLAYQIGMAMVLNKPIYVLHDGLRQSEIPPFLSQFALHPLSELHAVTDAIARESAELQPAQRRILQQVYKDFSIPVDRLISLPPEADELAATFNHRSAVKLNENRILQELIRMRKRGELPRI